MIILMSHVGLKVNEQDKRAVSKKPDTVVDSVYIYFYRHWLYTYIETVYLDSVYKTH